jgi:integrase
MQKINLATPATTSSNSLQAMEADRGSARLPEGVPGGSDGTPETPQVESYFDPQVVVTLDPDGEPLSQYGDRRWDLRSMSTDGGHTPHFLSFFETQALSVSPKIGRPDLAALIREQQKALLWLHMDAGRQRAQKTTLQAGRTLNQLARGAYSRGISLFELFCDSQALGEESAELNSGYAKTARALLRTLWRHRHFLKIGLEVRLKQLVEVIKQSAPEDAEGSQTPIIPSRIYCALLAGLLGSLDEIERGLDTLLDAYRRERSSTLNAPKGLTESQLNKHRDKQLREVREAMRARGWSEGSLHNFVAGEIVGIQLRLMNVVIAFTGMRVAEVLILPLKGVLEEVDHRGSVHHVVNGYSHKLNGGRKKPASWVTNREGHRAILLAQRVASAILEVLKVRDPANDDAALLFCSTANPYRKQNIANIYTRLHDELIPDVCAIITQADIDELNAMELERGWLREGIEVGKPWPLTFHQYRRSLSVYAHRSGMVSLPALKGQLQHITDEMRAYYSDGFCRAVNLVFDKEHFSHEWNAAKSESSFLAYSLALLFSDEDLIGDIGGRGAARIQQTVSSRPKEETLKLFRDGKLAYRETVLGGCIAVEECDDTPLEPIPWDCLEKDCPNAVVFGKRLGLLIRTQETVVTTLASTEAGSVEHRLEADHLQVLLKARKRLTEAV